MTNLLEFIAVKAVVEPQYGANTHEKIRYLPYHELSKSRIQFTKRSFKLEAIDGLAASGSLIYNKQGYIIRFSSKK
jgi:hypothetical protein